MLRITVFLSFFTTALSCLAAPTLKDYGSLPNVSMVAVSPNGNLVAFRRVKDGKDILNIISIAEKKSLPGLDLSSIQPKTIRFLDNETIYLQAATYGRVSGFRGKFETSTGFAFNTKTNKVRQLLIPGQDAIYPGQTGLGEIVGFSKDRDYVLMPAFVGTTDLILGKPLDPNYALVRVKISKHARPKRESAGSIYSTDFFVDSEGKLVAEERYDHRKNLHSIWTMKNGELRELYSETTEIREKAWVGLAADSQSLIFLDTNEDTGRTDFHMLNLNSGNISKADLGKADSDIEAVISDNNRVVQGIRYSGFSPAYKFFDSQLDARIQKIISLFPDQSVWITDQSPDWKHVVIYVEGSNYVGDYYLVGPNNEPLFLTSSRHNITQADINPIGKITLTSRDGLRLPTLLTIPKTHVSNMKNLPAVVFPHGGPRSYDRIGFDYFAQAMASQGFMVVQPQFRGSSGFGQQHASAGNGEWGGKMQDDITDSVNSLAQKGIIDPSRVCIVGISYGGYAALAGGAFTPDVYKCIVSINGVANLADMYQYDKYEHGHHHDSVAYLEMQFAANAKGEIDKVGMKARSPEMHADKFLAPVMLIHAENDEIVPFRQSMGMKSALTSKKKKVELIKLAGDSHHLQNNETRQTALESTINFLNLHLK